MRLFETILLISLLLVWIVDGWIRRKATAMAGCLLVTGVALLQLIVEGYRWQMLLLYLLTAVYMLSLFRKARRHREQIRRRHRLWHSLLLVGIAVSAVIPILVPVFHMDPPTGPYAVGTVTYDWVDESREETNTATPGDKRELLVQVWYPAQQVQQAAPALYAPEYQAFAQSMQQEYKVPSFLLGHLRYVTTDSTPSAPMAKDQASYPLILFSHGLPGARFTSTYQMEELASHGYIVAAIQHTYYAMSTVFPDQRVAPKTKKLPSIIDLDGWDQTIGVWVKDAQFTLNQLEKLSKQDPQGMLTGKINWEQVGMLGHSFGGAATIQTLYADPRVKAGINMDGTPFGKTIANGLDQPFMLMKTESKDTGESAEPSDQQLAKIGVSKQAYDKYKTEIPLRNRSLFGKGGGYVVTISGIKHMSFTDYYSWSPGLRLMDGLKLAPAQARRIIDSYVLDFFDTNLKHQPSKLLDQPASPYPEVTVEKK